MYVHDKQQLIEDKHHTYLQEHVRNKRPRNARVRYRVQVSSGLPSKRDSNLMLEVLQKCCND